VRLLAGRLARQQGSDKAQTILEEAASDFEKLSVPPLAQHARELLAIG